jgi:hypothetical protein
VAGMDTITTTPVLTELPAREVLTVDGTGSPESAGFQAAIRALVVVRAALGARDGEPFEGSYAQDGDPHRFDLHAPDGWHWRLLAPAPPGTTAEAITDARVRLRHEDARCVARLLHEGPYENEAPSLKSLYDFVAAQGLTPAGAHTEIYLNDPGRTAPADLRTILQVTVG